MMICKKKIIGKVCGKLETSIRNEYVILSDLNGMYLWITSVAD